MKEIKFRAWDTTQKKMITNFLMPDAGPSFNKNRMAISFTGEILAFTDWEMADYEESEMTNTACYPERFEVMQYTGLKDKNGKDIYEGDVLKGTYMESPHPNLQFKRIIGQVEYSGCRYRIEGVKQYEYYYAPLDSSYVIIGNIYENPELLKEEKHEYPKPFPRTNTQHCSRQVR